ncbi:MAG: hypothetical protein WC829_06195, partial [Hyphomicrobium sp.]
MLLIGKPVPTFPEALSRVVLPIGKPVATFPEALSRVVLPIGKPVPTFPEALMGAAGDVRHVGFDEAGA